MLQCCCSSIDQLMKHIIEKLSFSSFRIWAQDSVSCPDNRARSANSSVHNGTTTTPQNTVPRPAAACTSIPYAHMRIYDALQLLARPLAPVDHKCYQPLETGSKLTPDDISVSDPSTDAWSAPWLIERSSQHFASSACCWQVSGCGNLPLRKYSFQVESASFQAVLM